MLSEITYGSMCPIDESHKNRLSMSACTIDGQGIVICFPYACNLMLPHKIRDNGPQVFTSSIEVINLRRNTNIVLLNYVHKYVHSIFRPINRIILSVSELT